MRPKLHISFASGQSRNRLDYTYDRPVLSAVEGQDNLTQLDVSHDGETYHYWYAYDDRGLLQEVKSSTGSSKPALADFEFTYNPMALVETRKIHEYTSGSFRQTLDYQYHLRDWLTDINDISSTSEPFAAHYDYYPDGNIQSATFYNAGSPLEQKYKYDFTYDPSKQLLSADYFYDNSGWQSAAQFDVSQLDYDPNGNILTLVRKDSSAATVDSLTYNYGASNRLQSLTDNAGQTAADWDAESGTFTYDANGNVIQVTENGATKFSEMLYDSRNLPVFLLKNDSTEIIYQYNAEGQRIYKKVDNAAHEHYIMDGSLNVGVVSGDSLAYWNLIAQGIAGRTEAGNKHYYLMDHLGSTRSVVNSSGSVQESYDYYPFGLKMPSRDSLATSISTKELFTGEELDDETGAYNLGARSYWAAIGRFPTVDRFTDNYPSLTPYQYAANNPMRFIDVNGDSIWINYLDAEGNSQRLLYTAGLTYTGDNANVAALVNTLNTISSVQIGNEVLATLIGSAGNYTVNFGQPANPDAGGQFSGNAGGSGGSFTLDPRTLGSVEKIAHEFFHGFQQELGSGGASILSEVESSLFGAAVALGSFNISTGTSGIAGTRAGNIYGNMTRRALSASSFVDAQAYFYSAVSTFSQGSFANRLGLYTGLPRKKANQKVIINRLYPLFR